MHPGEGDAQHETFGSFAGCSRGRGSLLIACLQAQQRSRTRKGFGFSLETSSHSCFSRRRWAAR
jgi:hypothetical protein